MKPLLGSKPSQVWTTEGTITAREFDLAKPYLEEHIRSGNRNPVRIFGRWYYPEDFQDPPMTVTVDLEDNPTLVGWVMNDE